MLAVGRLLALVAAGLLVMAGCSEDDDPETVEPVPRSKYLYVSNSADNTIMGFKIARTTGALTELANSPWSAATGPDDMCADPNGEFLFVSNSLLGDISVFEVGADNGDLTEVPGSPFAAGASTGKCHVDPAGVHLYTVSASNLAIHVFDIEDDGTLSEIQAESTGAVLSASGLSASGTFYIAAESGTGLLHTYFVIPGGGGLATVANSPFMSGGSPQSVVFTPDGAFVYVSENASNTLYMFGQDPDTGALTAVTGSPVATAGTTSITELAVDPKGKHLYVSDDLSILAYEIGSDGTLTAATPASVATNDRSQALAFDTTGIYLYKTGDQTNRLVAFKRNTKTGALTQLTTSPYTTGGTPTGAAIVNLIP